MSLVFFKQAMHGDVLKYNTESSMAGTGGGAMDLRVTVALEPVLRILLPQPTTSAGVTHGLVRWDSANGVGQIDVELMPPNNSRDGEVRISQIYRIGGWEINEQQFLQDQAAGLRTFYVLERRANGDVFARVLRQAQFAGEQAVLVNHILSFFGVGNPNHAIRGAVDLASGQTY